MGKFIIKRSDGLVWGKNPDRPLSPGYWFYPSNNPHIFIGEIMAKHALKRIQRHAAMEGMTAQIEPAPAEGA